MPKDASYPEMMLTFLSAFSTVDMCSCFNNVFVPMLAHRCIASNFSIRWHSERRSRQQLALHIDELCYCPGFIRQFPDKHITCYENGNIETKFEHGEPNFRLNTCTRPGIGNCSKWASRLDRTCRLRSYSSLFLIASSEFVGPARVDSNFATILRCQLGL